MARKKALAVISFGTSYPEARRAIETLEHRLSQAMPEYDFYRAFTSQMIIRKIQREEGTVIPNPAELWNSCGSRAMKKLCVKVCT